MQERDAEGSGWRQAWRTAVAEAGKGPATVVDVHQHLCVGFDDLDPLVNAGLADQVWLMSTGGYTKTGCGDEEILAASERFPDFFVPFGFLDFNKDVDAIDALRDRGFVGIGEVIYPPKPYGDESLFPYYERIEKLGMPILFHAAGANYRPQEKLNIEQRLSGGRFMHVYHLDIIAKMFPSLTIIGAHVGCPWYDEAISVCSGHPNVYLDISDGLLVRNIHKVKEALAIPGMEDKLLFGTDCCANQATLAAKLTHFWDVFLTANVTQRARDKIMGGNAKRILSVSSPSKKCCPAATGS